MFIIYLVPGLSNDISDYSLDSNDKSTLTISVPKCSSSSIPSLYIHIDLEK